MKPLPNPGTLGSKTSITQVTVANERLYKLVAYRADSSPKQVEECIQVLSKYIRDTMERGAFEGIMIPYFGKIKVKPSRAQWMNHAKVMPKLSTHLQPKTPQPTDD